MLLTERGRIDSSHQMTDEILEYVQPFVTLIALGLIAWTRIPITQASVRDSSRLFSSTNNYHWYQFADGRSAQHYAWNQQHSGDDQVKATERLHHRRLPDRRLPRLAAKLHHQVKPAISHPYFYSLGPGPRKALAPICTHANVTFCCYASLVYISYIACDSRYFDDPPRRLHASSPSSSLAQSFRNLLNLLRTFCSGR